MDEEAEQTEHNKKEGGYFKSNTPMDRDSNKTAVHVASISSRASIIAATISCIGIIVVACINLFPIFLQNKEADTGTNLVTNQTLVSTLSSKQFTGDEPIFNYRVLGSDSKSTQWKLLHSGDTVHSGNYLKIEITALTDKLYLYILLRDASGNVQWLFPPKKDEPISVFSKLDNPLEEDSTITIPNNDVRWVLDNVIGYEEISFIVARQKLPEIYKQYKENKIAMGALNKHESVKTRSRGLSVLINKENSEESELYKKLDFFQASGKNGIAIQTIQIFHEGI